MQEGNPIEFSFTPYYWQVALLKLLIALPFIIFALMLVGPNSGGALKLIVGSAAAAITFACCWAAWGDWCGWRFTQNRKQFIRLEKDRLDYFIYPQGAGSIPYMRVTDAAVCYRTGNNCRRYAGELWLEYTIPEKRCEEIVELDLSRLRHPTLRFWQTFLSTTSRYERTLDNLAEALSEQGGFCVRYIDITNEQLHKFNSILSILQSILR
jgi:hypothetical protein